MFKDALFNARSPRENVVLLRVAVHILYSDPIAIVTVYSPYTYPHHHIACSLQGRLTSMLINNLFSSVRSYCSQLSLRQ